MRHLALLLSVVAAGCGGSASTTPSPTPVSLTSIVIAGNTTFTDRSQTSQLTATASFSNGMLQDQTRAATWTSSNPAIATVTTTGLVTAVATGTTTIAATFEGVQGSKTANVTVACQANNTGLVRFANTSPATTQAVVWDGIGLFTLTPGQTSDTITAAAGVAHNLMFKIAGTSTLACATSAPILAQCSSQTISCAFP